jgi:hypothetical protein
LLQVAEVTAAPTIDEWLERIEQRPKGALSACGAVDAIRAERARR